MCTALTLKAKDKHLFGRNMDIETSFGQSVVITPRDYQWDFKFVPAQKMQYATIGMGFNLPLNGKTYPLYAECANEKGLAMAGLNFPHTAHYEKPTNNKNTLQLAPYEITPYILCNFTSVKEVREWFKNNDISIVNEPITPQLPVAPLHFIVADKYDDCIVIEPTAEGIKIYDNQLGIMSNNPTFDWHLQNLAFYQNLGVSQKEESNWNGLEIAPFGEGFASVGLPGDWTPPARFIRTAFLKVCSDRCIDSYEKGISQFFHILDNVAMVEGSIRIPNQFKKDGPLLNELTLYSSAIDLEDGIYYYKTYYNNQINAIDMHCEQLDGSTPISYPFANKQAILYVNK